MIVHINPGHKRSNIKARRLPLHAPMNRSNDELKYWRELWREARRFVIDLPEKKWLNYWHTHFDWHDRGKRSRFEHRKHIRPLMLAFTRVQRELEIQSMPYQVYVCIHPSNPGSDALYVHTPNPHDELPTTFENCQFTNSLPPLLMGLVSKDRYKVGFSKYEGEKYYTIIPR